MERAARSGGLEAGGFGVDLSDGKVGEVDVKEVIMGGSQTDAPAAEMSGSWCWKQTAVEERTSGGKRMSAAEDGLFVAQSLCREGKVSILRLAGRDLSLFLILEYKVAQFLGGQSFPADLVGAWGLPIVGWGGFVVLFAVYSVRITFDPKRIRRVASSSGRL